MRFLNRAYSWSIFNGGIIGGWFESHAWLNWLLWYTPFDAANQCSKRAGISPALCGFFSNLFSQSNFFSFSCYRGIYAIHSLQNAFSVFSRFRRIFSSFSLHSLAAHVKRDTNRPILFTASLESPSSSSGLNIVMLIDVDPSSKKVPFVAKCGRKKTGERGRSTGYRDTTDNQTVGVCSTIYMGDPCRFAGTFPVSLRARMYRSGCGCAREKLSTFRLYFGFPVNFIQSRQSNRKKGGHPSLGCNQSVTAVFFVFSLSVTCDSDPDLISDTPTFHAPSPCPSEQQPAPTTITHNCNSFVFFSFFLSFSTQMFNGSALINSPHTFRKTQSVKKHTIDSDTVAECRTAHSMQTPRDSPVAL